MSRRGGVVCPTSEYRTLVAQPGEEVVVRIGGLPRTPSGTLLIFPCESGEFPCESFVAFGGGNAVLVVPATDHQLEPPMLAQPGPVVWPAGREGPRPLLECDG